MYVSSDVGGEVLRHNTRRYCDRAVEAKLSVIITYLHTCSTVFNGLEQHICPNYGLIM